MTERQIRGIVKTWSTSSFPYMFPLHTAPARRAQKTLWRALILALLMNSSEATEADPWLDLLDQWQQFQRNNFPQLLRRSLGNLGLTGPSLDNALASALRQASLEELSELSKFLEVEDTSFQPPTRRLPDNLPEDELNANVWRAFRDQRKALCAPCDPRKVRVKSKLALAHIETACAMTGLDQCTLSQVWATEVHSVFVPLWKNITQHHRAGFPVMFSILLFVLAALMHLQFNQQHEVVCRYGDFNWNFILNLYNRRFNCRGFTAFILALCEELDLFGVGAQTRPRHILLTLDIDSNPTAWIETTDPVQPLSMMEKWAEKFEEYAQHWLKATHRNHPKWKLFVTPLWLQQPEEGNTVNYYSALNRQIELASDDAWGESDLTNFARMLPPLNPIVHPSAYTFRNFPQNYQKRDNMVQLYREHELTTEQYDAAMAELKQRLD